MYTGNSGDAVRQFVRIAVVIAILLAAVPLGFFCGGTTVSALTDSLAAGSVMLAGSVIMVAIVGLGLDVAGEGAVPKTLKAYTDA